MCTLSGFQERCPAHPKDDSGEPPGPITTPLPPTREPAEGVAFTTTDTEGNELGGCTTNENGTCTASLPPVEQTIIIEEDGSDGKPGYPPMTHPIETSTFLSEFNPHRENVVSLRRPYSGAGQSGFQATSQRWPSGSWK